MHEKCTIYRKLPNSPGKSLLVALNFHMHFPSVRTYIFVSISIYLATGRIQSFLEPRVPTSNQSMNQTLTAFVVHFLRLTIATLDPRLVVFVAIPQTVGMLDKVRAKLGPLPPVVQLCVDGRHSSFNPKMLVQPNRTAHRLTIVAMRNAGDMLAMGAAATTGPTRVPNTLVLVLQTNVALSAFDRLAIGRTWQFYGGVLLELGAPAGPTALPWIINYFASNPRNDLELPAFGGRGAAQRLFASQHMNARAFRNDQRRHQVVAGAGGFEVILRVKKLVAPYDYYVRLTESGDVKMVSHMYTMFATIARWMGGDVWTRYLPTFNCAECLVPVALRWPYGGHGGHLVDFAMVSKDV